MFVFNNRDLRAKCDAMRAKDAAVKAMTDEQIVRMKRLEVFQGSVRRSYRSGAEQLAALDVWYEKYSQPLEVGRSCGVGWGLGMLRPLDRCRQA